MLHNIAEDPTIIKRIITANEIWIYEYDVKMSNYLANDALYMRQNR